MFRIAGVIFLSQELTACSANPTASFRLLTSSTPTERMAIRFVTFAEARDNTITALLHGKQR